MTQEFHPDDSNPLHKVAAIVDAVVENGVEKFLVH